MVITRGFLYFLLIYFMKQVNVQKKENHKQIIVIIKTTGLRKRLAWQMGWTLIQNVVLKPNPEPRGRVALAAIYSVLLFSSSEFYS